MASARAAMIPLRPPSASRSERHDVGARSPLEQLRERELQERQRRRLARQLGRDTGGHTGRIGDSHTPRGLHDGALELVTRQRSDIDGRGSQDGRERGVCQGPVVVVRAQGPDEPERRRGVSDGDGKPGHEPVVAIALAAA